MWLVLRRIVHKIGVAASTRLAAREGKMAKAQTVQIAGLSDEARRYNSFAGLSDEDTATQIVLQYATNQMSDYEYTQFFLGWTEAQQEHANGMIRVMAHRFDNLKSMGRTKGIR